MTFSALFFVVDQAQRDQFIFVDDLAGFLSCSFLQVSRTLNCTHQTLFAP
jgi:hypothetical protein